MPSRICQSGAEQEPESQILECGRSITKGARRDRSGNQGRGSFPVNLVLPHALSGKSESLVEHSLWVGYCQLEVGIVP